MHCTTNLHIVMLPWLAMGHLFPFLELSKRLARHGHHVSFLTTPANIQRLLPSVPSSLSPLLQLIELCMPVVEHLPEFAEATIDLPSDDLRPYLRIAYDTLHSQLSAFLCQSALPADWVLYDYAAHWAPAASGHVPCAYLSLFNAWTLGFIGSPTVLRGEGPGARTTPDDFTKVPGWVPFRSTIAYRPHEARALFAPGVIPDASGISETGRFAATIEGAGFVAVRGCQELEPEWLELLGELYQKPVIPVGLLPPLAEQAYGDDKKWITTSDWLDKQEPGTVVYAAFGSEVKLSNAQLHEVARGLELSGLPFVWASRAAARLLPDGFERRTAGWGLVLQGWAPQVRILAHPAIGGFLTHCGWNSVVEGLSFGIAMVLLPLVFDQGLNARSLAEKGVGVEVVRSEDGSFTGEGIRESLRLVMVEEEGKQFRTKAKEFGEKVFGDEELQDKYVGEFVNYLLDHRQLGTASLAE